MSEPKLNEAFLAGVAEVGDPEDVLDAAAQGEAVAGQASLGRGRLSWAFPGFRLSLVAGAGQCARGEAWLGSRTIPDHPHWRIT